MGLNDLDLKSVYYSDEDNLLFDFYLPVLSNSIKYNRIAGYFCSNSLAIAAKGIAHFIKNGGKIKLIANVILSEEDQNAIKEAICQKEQEILIDIETLEDQFKKNHIRMLCWMVKNNLLGIKIAVVKKGIEHQKMGILEDSEGNIISFSGSDNETVQGWLFNDEQFHVFRSWKDGDTDHLLPEIRIFDSLWEDKRNRVRVYEVSEAFKAGLIKNAPEDDEEFKRLSERVTEELLSKFKSIYTKVEKKDEIKLRDYQKKAITRWLENNCKGIFEMATGTGKTFTSLGCMDEILKEHRQLLVVIACPYTHLVRQWADEVKKFGLEFESVIADSSNYKWKDELIDKTYDIKNKILDKLIVYTTHATFSGEEFIQFIKTIKLPSLLICDEVHGIGAPKRVYGLIDNCYYYRLGLSATPSRWFDDIGTSAILNYFDKVVFEFSLKEAINTINPDTGDSYLVKYDYLPHFVELTDYELDQYEDQSKKIAKSFFASKDDAEKNDLFNLLCIKRQKIITNAENKYNALIDIIPRIDNIKHCLVYCSPNQIDRVQSILEDFNIRHHKFTDEEGITPDLKYDGLSEREHLLRLFEEGKYHALVAMKCLDQGVDIRPAKTAIFMASSGNPMEYIQRRGRILRPFRGKNKAYIYDILVVPTISRIQENELKDIEKRILEKELIRYEEFASAADNRLECIEKIMELYNKVL